MVFSNLGLHEKDAFFDLLDEYFSSRQDLLKSLSSGEGGLHSSNIDSRAAVSAVHTALASNPKATAGLISAGLKHGSQNGTVKDSPFAKAASNPEVANSIGRVAAASLAFGQRSTPPPPPPAPRSNAPPPTPARSTPPAPPTRTMPPTLPRRTSSNNVSQAEEDEGEDAAPAPPVRSPSTASRATGTAGLSSGKAFGDVNMNSFKDGFISVKNGTRNKYMPPPSVAPSIPSAFPKKQNSFAPPPIRRVSTNESIPKRSPEPELEPEPEDDSEWAEALYEYSSGEPGDLALEANQRVKIISRDSDDWWTGEVDGRRGLFPASYVRSL